MRKEWKNPEANVLSMTETKSGPDFSSTADSGIYPVDAQGNKITDGVTPVAGWKQDYGTGDIS